MSFFPFQSGDETQQANVELDYSSEDSSNLESEDEAFDDIVKTEKDVRMLMWWDVFNK